jgi:hypothetical protein
MSEEKKIEVTKPHPLVYRAPTPFEVSAMNEYNVKLIEAWDIINNNIPDSAEKTLAMRKLQESRMWANCAIISNGIKPERQKEFVLEQARLLQKQKD